MLTIVSPFELGSFAPLFTLPPDVPPIAAPLHAGHDDDVPSVPIGGSEDPPAPGPPPQEPSTPTGQSGSNEHSTDLSRADLVPSQLLSSSTARWNETIQVSWQVSNQGQDDLTTSWTDRLYLSKDTTFDAATDRPLSGSFSGTHTGLAAGQSYVQTSDVAIPVKTLGTDWSLIRGDWYLLIVTDAGGDQVESNETNNVVAKPIHIDATGSGAVIIDGGDRDDHGRFSTPRNIDGWQFIEQMTQHAIRSSYNDAPKDILAMGVTGSQALAAITSVANILHLNVTTVSAGALTTADFSQYKMLYVPSSSNQTVGGISNSDLIRLVQRKSDIQQFVNRGGSLVALTEANATSAYSWLELPGQFTISAPATIDDDQYQTQALIDAGLVITNAELKNGTPLHNIFTGPVGFNGLQPFVFSVGPDNVANNGGGDDQVITLGLAPGSAGIAPADLKVQEVTAPASARLQESITVNWKVVNQGQGAATSTWNDFVFLSNDTVFDPGIDLQLASVSATQFAPLAVNAEYAQSTPVTIPTGVSTSATWYLLVFADRNNNQSERDETNNILALPIDLQAPDLVALDVTAPNSGDAGQEISVSWKTRNRGDADASGPWRERVWLSADATAGNDTLLGEFLYQAGIPAGGDTVHNEVVRLPAGAFGERWLIVTIDDSGDVVEDDENNNSAVSVQSFTIRIPDLDAESIDPGTTAQFNSSLDVSWSVVNSGSATVAAPWTDQIWLSRDPLFDGNDVRLGSADSVVSLAPGAAYTKSASVTLPLRADLTEGDYYLLLVSDASEQLLESNESNNVLAKLVHIVDPQLPDLAVTSIGGPEQALPGATISLTWRVSNKGTAATNANWQDFVYVSTSNSLVGATLLTAIDRPRDLTIAGVYEQTAQITLPNLPENDYYILVDTDGGHAVFEGLHEDDNLLASSTLLHLRHPVVSWDGGGDGTSWHDPLNWSGDALPGPNDDVRIDLPNSLDITFADAAGDVTVHSLTSSRPFSITGGSLTVLAASAFDNSLTMTGGSLTAKGAGTTLIANGPTSASGVGLMATDGATLSLPHLQSYNSGAVRFPDLTASGNDSRLDLSSLTSLISATTASLDVIATDGGVIDLRSLAQLDQGGVNFTADGTNSLVNLSALTTYRTAADATYDSMIRIKNTGEVRVSDALTALHRVNLLIGAGTLKTSQLTSFTSASLTVSISGLDLSGLTNLDGVSIAVMGGATLSLPQITSYNSGTSRFPSLTSTGQGSHLELGNLTSLISAPNALIDVVASDGAVIDLHSIVQLTQGGVDFTADGTDSLVDLSALTTFSTAADATFDSMIRIKNNGEVRVNDTLTELHRVNLLIGTGTLKTAQLTSFTSGSLTISTLGVDLSGVNNLDGISISVTNGATLSLPQITSYSNGANRFPTLAASGKDSRLLLGNLTSLIAAQNAWIDVRVSDGAWIDLHSLGQLNNGAVNITVDGSDSWVNLAALSTFSTVNGATYSSAAYVKNGGRLSLGANTTVSHAAIILTEGGKIDAGTLTLLASATLSGSGTVAANLVNAGQIAPGATSGSLLKTGILSIQGNYTQTSTGVLSLELAGTTPGSSFDQVDITGIASLDGSLGLQLLNGFSPSLNSELSILTYESQNGAFALIDGLSAGTGKSFVPQYDPTSLDLRVVSDNASELTIGVPASGSIDVPGSADSWYFSAVANQNIFVDFQDLSGGPLNIALLAPDGSTVFTRGSSISDGMDTGPITLLQAGIYTLIVTSSGNNTPDYKFTVRDVPPPTEETIDYGTSIPGAIDTPGASRVYHFAGAIGRALLVNFAQLSGGSLSITLLGPDGSTLLSDSASAHEGLDNGPIAFTQDGTYSLIVSGVGDDTPTYEFTLANAPAAIARGTWDGGGDGTSWNDPLNWSGDVLPGADDDVTIDLPGKPSIAFTGAAGNVQIHSLQSTSRITISGGALTVRSSSTIDADLAMTGGSLKASGAGTTLSVTGAISILNGSLFATGGATLAMPELTTYISTVAYSSPTIAADGAGSRIDLRNLTVLKGATSVSSINIRATGGGVVDLRALPQIVDGPASFSSDGAASLIDLSALTTFSTATSTYDSALAVSGGGEIRINDGLTELHRVSLKVGDGILKTAQLTALSQGELTVIGESIDFGGVTNIDGVSLYAKQGGKLSFPQVTSYTVADAISSPTIQASGAGSVIDLRNATLLIGATSVSSIHVIASDGGMVDLRALPQIIDGPVAFQSQGNGSLIDLSALTTFSTATSTYRSSLTVSDSGEILLAPTATTLTRVDVVMSASGVLRAGRVNLAADSTLTGAGTIDGDLQNAGQVSPGATSGSLPRTGIISVLGNYIQTSAGVLSLDVGGLTAGVDYDQLQVSGNAQLDGSLGIRRLNSFSPPINSELSVMKFATSNGTFSVVDGLTAGSGKSFAPQYHATSITLLVGYDHASAIEIGDPIQGAIKVPGAADAWFFDATANQSVFIDFQQLTGGTLHATLLAPNGTAIFSTSSSRTGGLDKGPLTLAQPGTYTLLVEASGNDTPDYEFKVWEVPAPDVEALAVGGSAQGQIETPGVTDRWKLTNNVAGRQIFIDFQDLFDDVLDASAHITVLDPNGAVLLSLDGSIARDLDQGPLTLNLLGDYTLVVGGVGDATPEYQFKLWDVPAPDVQTIALGDTVEGDIETPGVVDRWDFQNTTAGRVIFIDFQKPINALALSDTMILSPLSSTDTSDGAVSITLLAPDGSMAFSSSHVLPGDLASAPIALNQLGKYTLIVGAPGDGTPDYQLQLLDVPQELDVQTIQLGQLAHGQIHTPGGMDRWEFANTTPGRQIFVDFQKLNHGGLSIKLLAPDASTIFSNSLASVDGLDTGPLTLDQSGTYALVASGVGNGTPDYEFMLWDVPPAAVRAMTVGDSAQGTIETPGASDRWDFENTLSGRQVFIDFQQLSGGSLGARLLAPDGSTVSFGAGTTESGLDRGPITLNQLGKYSIVVNGVGDDTAGYRFQLWDVPEREQHAINIGDEAQGTIATPGASTEYRFSAAPGQSILLDVSQVAGAGQVLGFVVRDADGNVVLDSRATSGASTQSRAALAKGGEYTLVVSGVGDDVAGYRLVMWNAPAAPAAVAANSVSAGRISSPSAIQEWNFTLDSPGTVSFEGIPGDSSYEWRLVSPSGQQLFDSTLSSDRRQIRTAETGTYRLLITGGSAAAADYQFRVTYGTFDPRTAGFVTSPPLNVQSAEVGLFLSQPAARAASTTQDDTTAQVLVQSSVIGAAKFQRIEERSFEVWAARADVSGQIFILPYSFGTGSEIVSVERQSSGGTSTVTRSRETARIVSEVTLMSYLADAEQVHLAGIESGDEPPSREIEDSIRFAGTTPRPRNAPASSTPSSSPEMPEQADEESSVPWWLLTVPFGAFGGGLAYWVRRRRRAALAGQLRPLESE